MHLFLMRHAEASPVGGAVTSDAQRPLTARGDAQLHAVIAEMQRRAVAIDRIVTSPLRRTVQTAERMAQAFAVPRVERADALMPSGEPPDVRPFLDPELSSLAVLIVGHHPDLALLANGMGAPGIVFRPGAVAFFEQSSERTVFLYRYLLTPDDLLFT